MKVRRFDINPIITPNMDSRMGDNINGPSLIRVPDWLPDPLGRYYLYFAHHNGKYIRMAYADKLEGPWKTYEPGVLDLEHSYFSAHVASPDVHVDHNERRIRMYYHGIEPKQEQKTRAALSTDGIHFTARPEILGDFYFRVIEYGGWHYAVARSGKCYRSRNPLRGFQPGPQISDERFRHCALRVDGSRLLVFYSLIGSRPEHILLSTVDLAADWTAWAMSEPVSVLEPEMPYEGTELPLFESRTGWAPRPVHEVRDPGIYREGSRTWLLHTVQGEHGIAVAELEM